MHALGKDKYVLSCKEQWLEVTAGTCDCCEYIAAWQLDVLQGRYAPVFG
jgi:hypothetical protein